MTLTCQDILDTDLSTLSTAAKSWKSMGERFGELKTDYDTHIRKTLGNGTWQGRSAEASRTHSTATAHEFTAAKAEARAVSALLSAGHKQLSRLKEALSTTLSDARAKGYHVDTQTGRVRVDWNAKPWTDLSPEELRAVKNDPGAVAAAEADWTSTVRKRVQAVCDADADLRTALVNVTVDDDGKGSAHGFNGGASGDISVNTAERAVQLADKGADMTATELNGLDDLLARHAKDPTFAETFAKRVGAQGTVDFWHGMAPYAAERGSPRARLLARVREHLGETLGTATRSDSPAMRRWEREMTDLGPERQGGHYAPRGYQVMADLLRHGDYDDRFLHTYGDSLVRFERDAAADGRSPADLWTAHRGTDAYSVEQLDNPWGNDPLADLMRGMSRNPGASTAFFTDPATFDYVVGNPGETGQGTVRDWPDVALPYGGTERAAGHDELGRALEAAVTGAPPGDPSSGLHRGPDEIKVMHRVMETYGGPYSPREAQPGISDSLGRMGAAYVDDLNYGLEDYGGAAEQIGSGRITGTDGHGIDPAVAAGFMRELGRDEESYRIMSAAEEGFVASRIHQFAGTDDVYRAAEIGAKGHGALDEARAEQIGADFRDDAAQRNAKLEEAANWKKNVASVAVYTVGGVAGAVAPEGSILIPATIGGGGAASVSAINEAINNALASDTYDNSGQSIHTLDQFDQRALENATEAIRGHMDEIPLGDKKYQDHMNHIENGYNRGRIHSDTDNSR
ncbi:hypothetical protein [Streptomyces sp. Z26]|uniref:hypothetical protein n=1 Tax=Streptomyces sp. Z26 TaxID=2500177 RepID=UPI000EF1388C|nr:hypothetical protein [Streptomyces sp. Z26]RLL67107.1 hypothetical protein D7M15_09775 [Streptomyces sp. Z26]